MFGGNNNNNNHVLPVLLDDNRFQYQTNGQNNQLQLFGNLPAGCNIDPVNYFGNEQNTSMMRPNKRGRESEDLSRQQKLQISLNYNICQEEADRAASIPKQNLVSTGLRLSYDDDERNSSVTSASGSMTGTPSILLSLGDNIKTELDRQKEEFDQFIKIQADHMAKGVRDLKQRHISSVLTTLEKGISKKLLEKEVELEADMHLRQRQPPWPPRSLLITFSLLLFLSFSFIPVSAVSRPYVLILSQDDLHESAVSEPTTTDSTGDSSEWDEFGDVDSKSEEELDPGSWRPVLESEIESSSNFDSRTQEDALYYSGVSKMVNAVSLGDVKAMEEACSEIEEAANAGDPNARSVLGFLNRMGIGRERNSAKAFLYHHFAAEGGNLQSKMAMAHIYARQDMYDRAVKLYAELAKVAVNSFFISKDSPILEPVRIHLGMEENKEALRKSRGEEDEDFQILEYQAQKGNAAAMYKIGLFYYYGLRGLRRDPSKGLSWFLKAVQKGEPRSMELLGEIYVKGVSVERNYTKALKWLSLAAKQNLYSAYNGIGYLYVKGYGVDEKNFTRAKELFEKAAGNEDPGGYYNLGVLYLKGLGVTKDVKLACKYFIMAANAGQPKAFFQLAKMFQTGIGLKKNLQTATSLYKLVAERGPWCSLSRWALESYLKGDLGKAFLLYSRMAELGYEVAQSNAAWILDKYGERSMCMGASGFCSDAERHQRAHSLWWQASEQGNEHAALLIGDAYYYGRGIERDYDRAAEAYLHAKSQSNAQAMFNLGYMHEHGQGLPFDLHLAKRYYDQALQSDPAAKLPVTLALTSLWIRKNYANSIMVRAIDSLPELYPKVEVWIENVIMEEGNATILTLFVCLLTVLYLRERSRRNAGAADIPMDVQPNNGLMLPPHNH